MRNLIVDDAVKPFDWSRLPAAITSSLQPLAWVLLAGVSGFFPIKLLFGVEFVTAELFGLCALVLFGPAWGVAAVLAGTFPTLFYWGHPYGIVIYTIGMAFVSWLVGRKDFPLTAAVFGYWLIPGSILTWLIYKYVLHAPIDSILFVLFKMGANGLAASSAVSLAVPLLYRLKPRVPWICPDRAFRKLAGCRSLTLTRFISNLMIFLLLTGMLAQLTLAGKQQIKTVDAQAALKLEGALSGLYPILAGPTGEPDYPILEDYADRFPDISFFIMDMDQPGAVRSTGGETLPAPAFLTVPPSEGHIWTVQGNVMAWAPNSDTSSRIAQRMRSLYFADGSMPNNSRYRMVASLSAAPYWMQIYRELTRGLAVLYIITGLAAVLMVPVTRRLAQRLTPLPPELSARLSRQQPGDHTALTSEELANRISHELRTPLTSILGFSEIMHNRELTPARQKRYVETIYHEAGRLSRLVDDFLDLQRMEAGHQRYFPAPVDMGRLAEETAHQWRMETNRTLTIRVPEQGAVVLADEDRMKQVLHNLLSNAFKYSPKGNPVSLDVRQDNGIVRVDITDEGLGIPEAETGNIFGKFYRVEHPDRRKIPGSGLGLPIVKEIVEAHRGEVTFRSEHGAGSVFSVRIPAYAAPDTEGKAVIIVRNEAYARELSAALQRRGHEALPIRSFEEVLFALRRGGGMPRLIAADLVGAGLMNGLEFASELRRLIPGGTPLIFLETLDHSQAGSPRDASRFFNRSFSPLELAELADEAAAAAPGGGSLFRCCFPVQDQTALQAQLTKFGLVPVRLQAENTAGIWAFFPGV